MEGVWKWLLLGDKSLMSGGVIRGSLFRGLVLQVRKYRATYLFAA